MATDTTAKNGQAVIRALKPGGVNVRAASDGGMPTLHGHFAVFNRFTEIDSWMEGHFMERIAPGAFKKTFAERTPKVLFEHGQDPQVGNKPLGAVDVLREDDDGAYYEVPMIDTSYTRDLIPGLEAGLYGSSFRFRVMRQIIDKYPKASDENPDRIEERTLTEVACSEFGVVTFPAYVGATAGVRSLTDRFLFEAIQRDPAQARSMLPAELRAVAETLRMDVEDLDTLAQMIQLGAAYIAEQDEPADQANVPKMEAIVASLTELVPYEVQEDEVEDEDDQAGRSKTPGRTLPLSTPPARAGTSDAERREADKRFRDEREWQEWLTSRT